jgi:hypothetical protein
MMAHPGAAILAFEERDDLAFEEFVRLFRWGGASTSIGEVEVSSDAGTRVRVNTFTNEFWTAKQRAAHSLHEISYLPRLLQAPTPALLYRATHRAGRCRV